MQITDVCEALKANLIFSMVSCSLALMEASKADSWSILIATKAVKLGNPQQSVKSLHSPFTLVSSSLSCNVTFQMYCVLRPTVCCTSSFSEFWFLSSWSFFSVHFSVPFLSSDFFTTCWSTAQCLVQLQSCVCRSCSFNLLAPLPIRSQRKQGRGCHVYNLVHWIFTRCQSFCEASVPFFVNFFLPSCWSILSKERYLASCNR